MCVMNACVTVPLYTICSITIEHKTAEGKFKKRYRKLSFTLKVLLRAWCSPDWYLYAPCKFGWPLRSNCILSPGGTDKEALSSPKLSASMHPLLSQSNMKDLVSKSSTPKKQNSPYASATSNVSQRILAQLHLQCNNFAASFEYLSLTFPQTVAVHIIQSKLLGHSCTIFFCSRFLIRVQCVCVCVCVIMFMCKCVFM